MKKFYRTLGAMLLLTVTLAIGSDARDPFIERVNSLNSLFDQTFLDSKLVQDLAGGKVYAPIPKADPRYQRVITEMKKFKDDLRLESDRRSSQTYGSAGLEALTAAAGQYLDIQAKLYPIYAKNAHRDLQGPAAHSFSELDELNLIVHVKVGLPFADNAALKRQYNVRHYKTAGWTELFVSENEKRTAEYVALLAPKTSHDYGKLVQMATIQETMVNRWAIRRLQTFSTPDQEISSCGPELLSFRMNGAHTLSDTDTYRSLLVDDNYLVFNQLKDHLRAASLDQPLASAADYGRIGKKVFESFSEYQKKTLPRFMGTENGAAQLENFFTSTLPTEMSQNEARAWLDSSSNIIRGVNFRTDDLSARAIAQRIVESEFRERKHALMDTLRMELASSEITEIQKNPEQSMKKIGAIIEQELQASKAEWISRQEALLAQVFEKNNTRALQAELVKARIDKLYTEISTEARDAIRAQNILSKIQKFTQDGVPLVKTNQNFYVRTFERDVYGHVLLDKVPATEALTDFVTPFTPGQLSVYFTTTLTKLGQGANVYDRRTSVAKKFQKSPIFSSYMGKFFETLQKSFDKTLKERHIDHVTAKNSPLESLIAPAALKTLSEMKAAMEKGSPKTAAKAPPGTRPRITSLPFSAKDFLVAPSDQTRLSAPMPVIVKKSKPRFKIDQFSLKPITAAPIDQTRRTLAPLIKDIKPDERVSDIDQRTQNTQVLADALGWLGFAPGQPVRLAEIGKTMQDQESIAMAIINEAFVNAPILQIDVKGFSDAEEGNRNRGIQFIADAYNMKLNVMDSKMAKETLSRLVAYAARNDQGKLETFCKADPRKASTDENMAKVFLVSSAIRTVMKGNNSALKNLDEELRKQTRTRTEKVLEDVLDPLAVFAFYLSITFALCTAGVAFGPLLWSLISGMAVSTGGAVAATSMLTTIFFGNFGMVNLTFIAQTAAQIQVNYFELPPQLSYQVSVANSQIGTGQLVTSREEILKANEKLTSGKIWTPINAFTLIPGLKPILGDIRTVLKIEEKAALKRLAGQDALKAALQKAAPEVLSIQKPFTQLVEEKGLYEATRVRAGQLFQDMSPVPNKFRMTEEALGSALSKKISMELAETSTLRKAYVYQISEDEAVIRKLTEQVNKVGDRYRPAPGSSIGAAGTDKTIELGTRIALFKHVISYRWRVAIGDLQYQKIAGGVMPIEWNRLPEMSFYASVAEIQSLKERIAYFEKAMNDLDELTGAARMESLTEAQLLERHLKSMAQASGQVQLYGKLFKTMAVHSIRSADSHLWEQAAKSIADYHLVKPHLATPDVIVDTEGNLKEAGSAGQTADYEDYQILNINADGTASWEQVDGSTAKK
ncbi:MAG: hypothetical protein H7222_06945 [Methylotenera sp.]|nr:hypothetical protein [Oligoflexia bacterium]